GRGELSADLRAGAASEFDVSARKHRLRLGGRGNSRSSSWCRRRDSRTSRGRSAGGGRGRGCGKPSTQYLVICRRNSVGDVAGPLRAPDGGTGPNDGARELRSQFVYRIVAGKGARVDASVLGRKAIGGRQRAANRDGARVRDRRHLGTRHK